MKIPGIPFVEEGLRTYASQPAILRSYLIVPCVLAVALLVAWPQGSVEGVFRGIAATDPFSVVAVTFLLFLLYLGGRYGSEDYSPETLVNLEEYVTLTPASVAALVAGKAAFALLHTLFLLSLGAPFLLAAYSVSGARAGSLAAALAVLAAAAFAVRMYGLLLLAAFGPRRLLRGAVFLASLALFLFATWFSAPAVNPIAVLLAARDLPVGALLVVFDAACALLFMMTVAFILRLVRRRRGAAARD